MTVFPHCYSYTSGPVEVTYYPAQENYLALTYGPLVLTLDEKAKTSLVRQEAETATGTVTLIDYASAGKEWDRPIGAWLPKETLAEIKLK